MRRFAPAREKSTNANTNTSALQLQGLVKHYRGGEETVRAVDGVTLAIEPGELVALYGPSGSGKSTLLMLIAALLAPDAGSIVFGGRDVARLSAGQAAAYRRHEVGLVSQEFHLIPGSSALDNAMIKLPVLGFSLREARARTLPWLERVGLAGRAGHAPESLSMGERQRVTIARALAAEPGLLLADEPTGNLDSTRTQEILILLREICRERAIPGLLVTHDADAVAFVDRVHTLRDGRLYEGSPAFETQLAAVAGGAMNPRIFGMRLDMLLYLYRRRLRAHPVAELLAGGGVAIGVALVFGVLLANASLTKLAGRLVHGLAGSARWELTARSSQGFGEGVVQQVGELEGVQVAAPVLRENVTLIGPGGRRAVQLIGVTPSLEALGGGATQELAAGTQLLKGGLGLPTGVASALGSQTGQSLGVASGGVVRPSRERVLLGESLAGVAASPVAVTLLSVAQTLTGHTGRVSELMIRPRAGASSTVAAHLARLASARHLELRPADDELRLLSVATKPNRQSTSLFSAIAVMIGFLLALNAMLLTVPERRRFIAELRMQGYDARQIVLLMGLQALVLGVVASLVGIALGDALARLFFQQVPGFLTAAFPIGAEEAVHAGTVLAAVACGVLATALATLAPLLDLRARRAGDAGLLRGDAHSETVGERTIALLGVAGVCLLVAALALALLVPSLTVVAGVMLALASVCLIPAVFAALARLLPYAGERIRSSALIVATCELRATTTRSVALAGIVCLAVYGSVAIGGARRDLLRGIENASAQYFATAQVWVNTGGDVFDTNSFAPGRPAAAIARAPGVAAVRVYQGGLLDVGERRMWVRARPAGDASMIEASQLLHGDYTTATSELRAGGWAAVSSDFAEERHLRVGGAFSLPTPSGEARLRVAAIATNSGWPAGAITLGAADYSRYWRTSEAAALEVSLKPGVSPAAGRRAVLAALGLASGLQVSTAGERIAQSAASARQGLRTLEEISTLLLVAAALAVATALSAAIWQRRLRLAALKIQGYDAGQLWRAVLLESGVTIGVGVFVGALVGVVGHALASRFLQLSTGFPAPFAAGPAQVVLTVALFAAIALATIALPGMAAARVSPRAVLQE